MITFTTTLWLFVLIPLALLSVVCFLVCNARRHIVDEPPEQELPQRFRGAGG
jgi:hypothetical protein